MTSVAFASDDPRAVMLGLLARPTLAAELDLPRWDAVIRVAREARLLGILDDRIARAGVAERVPERVGGHLAAARAVAAYRAQMLKLELAEVARVLRPLGIPLAALKGAAYLLRNSTAARGRLPADIDVLVPAGALDAVEARLVEYGWESTVTDAYDQRYYREWSHELPPMRFTGREVELDLHHGITPPTSRFRRASEALVRDIVPVEGTAWHALAPNDQLLHVAIHLTQDSELDGRVRELVDFHALATDHPHGESDWRTLLARAEELGLTGPLALTVLLVRDFLAPDFGDPIAARLERAWRSSWVRLGRGIAHRTLLPPIPDTHAGFADRMARVAAVARYQWMRMPPQLLVRHVASKAVRRLRSRASGD